MTAVPTPSTRRPRSVRRRAAAPVLIALVLGLLSLFGAPSASAHGGDGKLEVVSVTPSARSAEITVKLTYQNDGHESEGATVTAAGESPQGLTLAPAVLAPTDEPGQYRGTVELPGPGTWNVRITSVTPPATTSVEVRAPADPSATVTTAADPTAGGDGTTTTEPAVISPAPASSDTGSSDDGGPLWAWVLGGAAAVVAVAVGLVFVIRGSRQGID